MIMLKIIIIALVGPAESKLLRYSESVPHRLLPSSGNYCGSTFETAAKCSQACPNGVDSECSNGETCFAGVTCSSSGGGGGDVGATTGNNGGGDVGATTGNYCGSTFDTAAQCAQACPNGVDSDCSNGERCFKEVNCTGGDGEVSTGKYCGSTFETATQCAQACPSGVDSECSSGEKCFKDVNCSEGGDGNGGTSAGNYFGSMWTAAFTLVTLAVTAGFL